jgi:hypothetical protein
MSVSMSSARADSLGNESNHSAVSWPAIIAGAFVASSLSLALLMLGAGLGLVSVSPWTVNNVSIGTFGALAAAWFIAVQLFASGVGGYLSGRLRTRWVNLHTDEVYFRDTAHGLLVWAVGAVVSASLLTSAVSSIATGAARLGGSAVQAVVTQASGAASSVAAEAVSPEAAANAYFADMLFRTDHPDTTGDRGASRAEVGRILASASLSDNLPQSDKTYVAQIVASQTGLSPTDAEKRVTDVIDRAKSAREKAANAAKAAADAARKTAVYVALWAFVSLLAGAFSASYMATIGGQIRDELK